jgi:hypothetical protein
MASSKDHKKRHIILFYFIIFSHDTQQSIVGKNEKKCDAFLKKEMLTPYCNKK